MNNKLKILFVLILMSIGALIFLVTSFTGNLINSYENPSPRIIYIKVFLKTIQRAVDQSSYILFANTFLYSGRVSKRIAKIGKKKKQGQEGRYMISCDKILIF